MPGIGTLQRLPPEKANVYHRLKTAMSRFRDWIKSRTIAQASPMSRKVKQAQSCRTCFAPWGPR